MQEEVAAQVTADDVGTAVLREKHDGLIHLVVCYETMLHDVQVPQLHHFLLSLIDICELIQLRGSLLSKPLWIPLVLTILFHLLGPQGHAAVTVEVQTVVSTDVGSLLLQLSVLGLQEL